MTDEAELIGLLHRADWTKLRLSAQVSDGSTVVIAPGKRYRYEIAGYVTGCDAGCPWELSDEEDDDDGRGSALDQRARAATAQAALPGMAARGLRA